MSGALPCVGKRRRDTGCRNDRVSKQRERNSEGLHQMWNIAIAGHGDLGGVIVLGSEGQGHFPYLAHATHPVVKCPEA